jgi:hypothetical protein
MQQQMQLMSQRMEQQDLIMQQQMQLMSQRMEQQDIMIRQLLCMNAKIDWSLPYVGAFVQSGAGQQRLMECFLHNINVAQPSVAAYLQLQSGPQQERYLECLIKKMDMSNPDTMAYVRHNTIPNIVAESPHPYADNYEINKVLGFGCAKSYTITFDARTKTELDRDWVTFYTDASKSHYWGEQKYSGGHAGRQRNFPGLDGKPSLVISASSFYLFFRSDTSNVDWGFKFTAVPQLARP